MSFKTVNPVDNQTIETFSSISAEEAQNRIAQSHAAFLNWRSTSVASRAEIMRMVARNLGDRQNEFAQLITLEMGKRFAEARYEINYCVSIANYYADQAATFLADEPLEVDDADAILRYEPLGVLLGVMPWNFPFYQVFRFAAPNIMCGNTLLIKHASNVPQCSLAIEKLFLDSGLPSGVLINMFLEVESIESVIADPRVRGVSLTGSERAGAAVASQAGQNLKRSVLELGGNDPLIVLEDADVQKTAGMAVRGRMVNAGQSCVASKRIIVVESIATQFLEEFKHLVSELKVGDPLDAQTDVAPLSTEAAAKNLEEQVNATVNAGAKVLLGGDRPNRAGAFFNPTILTGVTPDMPSYDQELFGPVATVYVVADEAEAIKLANDSSFGLGGSVFTEDLERGKRVARQIESGMVFINRPTRSQVELPFGGIKNSGYGREMSRLGMLEFVNKKLIHCPRS